MKQQCINCGSFIEPGEVCAEVRNDYGYPTLICSRCQGKNSDSSEYYTYYDLSVGD